IEARHQPVHCAEIEGERRPAILARRDEPIVELDLRCPGVRFGAAAELQLNQRVRFLDARREDAALAMVFEAAADEMDIVGEQRRCQGVAGKAGEAAAVEDEAKRAAAVDPAALRQTIGLRHPVLLSTFVIPAAVASSGGGASPLL